MRKSYKKGKLSRGCLGGGGDCGMWSCGERGRHLQTRKADGAADVILKEDETTF